MKEVKAVLIFALNVALAVLALNTRATARQPQQNVADLVAAARTALGGEAALNAVTSFTLSGSFVRNVGPAPPTSVMETSCVLPDKFLRVSRHNTGGPVSFEITSYDGFNGDRVIHDTVAPNAPFPVTMPGPLPATQEEADARLLRQRNAAHRDFVKLVLPMFMAVPPAYGVRLSMGEPVTLKGGQADVLIVKYSDGTEWQLRVDAKTHLPLELRWMAKPAITRSVVRTSNESRSPTPNLPADPTAGLQDVQWVMAIRDYKVADGVNWPRRLSTSFDGKSWEDIRVSKYRLNPQLDPKIFDRTK